MRGRRAFAFDEKMRLDKGGLWNGADNRKAGRTEAYKKKKDGLCMNMEMPELFDK